MAKFAFYGRVSTEDQQDPKSSKDWQLARSRALIEPHGGVVVAEFFDVGLSRSLPWKRRPQANLLLAAFKDPDRGFEAVVIGEPARAFYGNQFGLTFPVLVHYGVQLWVPEVGGQVDPGSDAHDLVMSLYGGMSKGERNRIKIRVRTAMAAQAARDGRFLGGRPPYGYRLADLGPHPNPGKAAVGQRLHQLEPDPVTAAIVPRIFAEFLGGRGLYAIAARLTADGVLSPSAYDRVRNRHRQGTAWSKSAVRVILVNPPYTGRQVWNKQRKDEILIDVDDVDDVAQGHDTVMRWNPQDAWIWSPTVVHEPLVDEQTYEQTQVLMAPASQRTPERMPRSTARNPYLLRGLLVCGLCRRRMQGNWNNSRPHYRCSMPSEYAVGDRSDHPRTIYVREDLIVGSLDSWLADVFSPDRVQSTVESMAATDEDPSAEAAREGAHEVLRQCDRRLATYRAALESGVDAAVVGGWIAEVQADRLRAETMLARATSSERMTRSQVQTLVDQLGSIISTLTRAHPEDRAEVYRQLAVHLIYDPARKIVRAEVTPGAPCAKDRVRGGT